MTAGAPRIITPPLEECVKLGKDLVQWATEESDDIRTSFSFWYALKHDLIYEQWKLLKIKPEFKPYYEKARAALALKLHRQQLEKGLSHRYISMYDRELTDHECEIADQDAERKKSIEGTKQFTYNILVNNDLAAGSKLSAQAIPEERNKSSK
jgi:regulator of sigma D